MARAGSGISRKTTPSASEPGASAIASWSTPPSASGMSVATATPGKMLAVTSPTTTTTPSTALHLIKKRQSSYFFGELLNCEGSNGSSLGDLGWGAAPKVLTGLPAGFGCLSSPNPIACLTAG